MSDFKIVSLVNPSVVVLSGATGPAIAAGGVTQTSGTVVFANTGNVTFGYSNGSITASAPAGGGGGIALGAGSQTATSGTVQFANSNGISFGMSGSNQITASYTVPAQSVQTQPSGNIAGVGFTSTTTAGTAVVGTLGTGGISLGVPAFLTTSPVQSVQPVAFSASGGSSNFSTLAFSNQNNDVTFLNSAGQVALSHSLQPLSNTSAITSNAINTSVSSLFQQTSNTSAITSNAFPSANTTKFAGTGTTFAGTNVSATVGLDSNGLNLALSAPSPGGGGAINVSAGTTSGNLQTIQFNDGNGVSFGLNGSTVTASVAPGGGGGIAAAAGTQTATSGTINFVNSNNVTFGMSNSSQITASFSQSVDTGRAGTGYTSTTQAGSTVGVTQGSNGLSAAWPPFITTYAAQSVQTQASGNIVGSGFTSTTTAGSVPVATLNSNGLSMGVPAWITTYVAQTNQTAASGGIAGTGTTLNVTNVGMSATLNSVGLRLDINNTDDHIKGWSLYGNTAGTSNTVYTTTGGLYLAGGANVTLSGNSNTITVVGPAPGGTTFYSLSRFDYPQQWQSGISSSQQTNANVSLVRILVPSVIQFTRIEVPVSISASSSNVANTAGIVMSSYGVLYTRNGSTLNPIVGVAGTQTLTWASNTSGYNNLTGPHMMSFGLQSTLTPGEYYLGVQVSTTSGTSVGTATTALNATISMVAQSIYTANAFPDWNVVSAATTNNWVQGLNSVVLTATNQTHQMSQMTMTGVAYFRAALPVVFRNY